MLIPVEIFYLDEDENEIFEEIDINTKQISSIHKDEENLDFCFIAMRNGDEWNVTMTRQAFKKYVKAKELTYIIN